MRIKVKSSIGDMVSFITHIGKRNRIFKKAAAAIPPRGRMNILAEELHPLSQKLKVGRVRKENSTAVTYRLVPEAGKKIAFFRAGQYLTLEIGVEGTAVSRPFSISSSPEDSYRGNYYEITVKNKPEGFASPYMAASWKEGTAVTASGPIGFFYYEDLRDSREIIFLAGGTGITPFSSMAPDILSNYPDTMITLFYGAASENDFLFLPRFRELEEEYPGRFKFVPIAESSGQNWNGETGFITADLIKNKTEYKNPSLFLCGPEGFHHFMDSELKAFDITPRYLRRENYQISSAGDTGKDSLKIDVTIGSERTVIDYDPGDTILVSMEKAGLNPPSDCRSGECGWCRSRLVSGEIETPPGHDRRRKADEKFGFFHPCSSYALSDLVMECPENPRKYVKE